MRLIAFLACTMLMVSCGAQPIRRSAHDALIVAFVDEFHSGVMLDRADVPADLLPAGGATVPTSRWVVLHFGERRWIRGEADSCIDALRLTLLTGDGGVQIDLVPWLRHHRGGTDPSHQRIWMFPASRTEVAGLIARLRAWIANGTSAQFLAHDTCWWQSSHAWSLACTCHDFTRDLLDGAGIGLGRSPLILANGMRAALDQVWAARQTVP